MIDKIVITLNDSGLFELNIGDMQFETAHTPLECMKIVNNYLRKLAYFPTRPNEMSANPIPFSDFKKK